MILYAESNFLLELIFAQEESAAAEEILQYAEAELLTLVLPSFSLSEPFSTLTHRRRERRRLSGNLLSDIKRTAAGHPVVASAGSLAALLIEMDRAEGEGLSSVMSRILSIASQSHFNSAVIADALRYRDQYDFSLEDAVVYASVLADLRSRPRKVEKCFVNRNWKDFGDLDIIRELRTYNCDFRESFTNALDFIRARLT